MKTTMQLMEELGLHEGGIENWIPGNAWESFADLIRADEREKVIAEFAEAEQEPEQTAIEQEYKDLRTPKERRAEGQWHCPECFTFGSTHRKGCTKNIRARGNT